MTGAPLVPGAPFLEMVNTGGEAVVSVGGKLGGTCGLNCAAGSWTFVSGSQGKGLAWRCPCWSSVALESSGFKATEYLRSSRVKVAQVRT